MSKMKKFVLLGLAALAVLASCKRSVVAPRPTIPMVLNILADTTGLARVAAQAGSCGADGAISIIGDPMDALALAHNFLSADKMDNVDGRSVRDSLPDFAGERFQVILDNYNAPYEHFVGDGPEAGEQLDSLREAAVRCALFAWDSTRVQSPSKILIYTSSLQAEYGLFDVDTLQQLTGGTSILLSSADILLDQAYESGARHMAVWTNRTIRKSGAWEAVFARKGWPDATLSVLSPDPALDVRTEFRNLLRQYRSTNRSLDVLILDSYDFDPSYLSSEMILIRQVGTEEDASFDRMLSKNFRFLEPKAAILQATYQILRERRLFTHRISRPLILYYETTESAQGLPVLEKVTPAYVQHTYVPNLH